MHFISLSRKEDKSPKCVENWIKTFLARNGYDVCIFREEYLNIIIPHELRAHKKCVRIFIWCFLGDNSCKICTLHRIKLSFRRKYVRNSKLILIIMQWVWCYLLNYLAYLFNKQVYFTKSEECNISIKWCVCAFSSLMFILSTLSLSPDQNGARLWLGTACEHWTLSPYEINWYLFLYINNNKMWMHFKCSVNALFVVVIVCALKMSPSSKCSQYTRMAPKYTTSVPIIIENNNNALS